MPKKIYNKYIQNANKIILSLKNTNFLCKISMFMNVKTNEPP